MRPHQRRHPLDKIGVIVEGGGPAEFGNAVTVGVTGKFVIDLDQRLDMIRDKGDRDKEDSPVTFGGELVESL